MHLSDNELVLVILFEKIVVQKNNLSFEPISVNETHTHTHTHTQTHSLLLTLALSLSHSLSLSSLSFPFPLSSPLFLSLFQGPYVTDLNKTSLCSFFFHSLSHRLVQNLVTNRFSLSFSFKRVCVCVCVCVVKCNNDTLPRSFMALLAASVLLLHTDWFLLQSSAFTNQWPIAALVRVSLRCTADLSFGGPPTRDSPLSEQRAGLESLLRRGFS